MVDVMSHYHHPLGAELLLTMVQGLWLRDANCIGKKTILLDLLAILICQGVVVVRHVLPLGDLIM